jgi:hypothetical protein
VRDSTFIRRLRHLSPVLPKSLQHLNEYCVDDFEDLLSRGWADRAWTYQELLLADNPIIICGSKSMSWDQFIRGLAFIKDLTRPPKYRKSRFWRFFDTYFGTQRAFLHTISTIVMDGKDPPLPGRIEAWMSLYYHWMHLDRNASVSSDDSRASGRRLTRGLSWSPWSISNAKLERYPSSAFNTYRDKNVKMLKILGAINLFIFSLAIFPVGLAMIGLLVFFYNPSEFGSIFGKSYIILWFFIALWIFPFTYASFYPLIIGSGPQTRESGLHNFRGILRALRTRVSTDPKDRSYSLYGILEHQGATLTTPEGSKTTREVYTDLLLDLLHWNNRSMLLLLDCCSMAEAESPTWVPNWLAATESCWLPESYIYGHSYDECAPASLCLYNTNGYRSNLTIYGINPRDACVSWISQPLQGGWDLDNVNGLRTESFNKDFQSIKQWVNQIRQNARVPSMTTPFFQGAFESIEGKLIEHHFENTGEQTTKALDDFATWFSILAEQESLEYEQGSSPLMLTGDRSSEITPPPAYILGSTEPLKTSTVAVEYHKKICQQITGKRLLCLFKTTHGTYMGTGPLSMKEGDMLVLISGLPVPLVLRKCNPTIQPDGATFKVIGPAFVPGMMRGEVWTWTTSQDPPRKDELTEYILE